MLQNQQVSVIMTENVQTVHEHQTLLDAKNILEDNSIHHVPVVQEGRLTGMISSTEIMKFSIPVAGNNSLDEAIFIEKHLIKDVMESNIVSINVNKSIRAAAEILADSDFHSLPVVDDDLYLVGIVTSSDLVRYILQQI